MLRKSFFIFLLLFLFISFSFARPKLPSFYSDLKLGLTLGEMKEYLYTSQNDRIISQLQYQEKPLYKITGEAGLIFYNFRLSFEGAYYLPLKCGRMFDYDWLEEKLLTNYSISDNYAKNNFYLSALLAYDFNFKNRFSLTPVFKILYQYDSFSTCNAHGWYGDSEHSSNGENVAWNSPEAAYYERGRISGNDFLRKSFFYFAGLSGKVSYNKLDFLLSLYISPGASFYSLDRHRDDNYDSSDFNSQEYSTAASFKSYFSAFSFDFSIFYKLTSTLRLSTGLNGFFIPLIKGKTYTDYYSGESFGLFSDSPQWVEIAQQSGLDSYEISFYLGVGFFK